MSPQQTPHLIHLGMIRVCLRVLRASLRVCTRRRRMWLGRRARAVTESLCLRSSSSSLLASLRFLPVPLIHDPFRVETDRRVHPSMRGPGGREKVTHPPSPGRTCHQRTPPTTRRASVSPPRARTSTRAASEQHDCGTVRRTMWDEGPAGVCRFANC